MIVVSDTSPILNLARIGRLDLLQSLYGQALIPAAVYAELTDARRDLPPAIDLQADLLLVDQRRGRRVAAAFGLSVRGLIGVVARAKQAGLIDRAKPVLDELIHTARFWIGPCLYAEVLTELGEA